MFLGTVLGSQKLYAIQVPINHRVNKYIVTCSYYETVLAKKISVVTKGLQLTN